MNTSCLSQQNWLPLIRLWLCPCLGINWLSNMVWGLPSLLICISTANRDRSAHHKSCQQPTEPLSVLSTGEQAQWQWLSPRFRWEMTPWGTSSAEHAAAMHSLCSSSLRAPLCWLSPSRITPKQQCTAMRSEWHRNHPADMETPRIFNRYTSLVSKWIRMPEGFCLLHFATGADFPTSPTEFYRRESILLQQRIYIFIALPAYTPLDWVRHWVNPGFFKDLGCIQSFVWPHWSWVHSLDGCKSVMSAWEFAPCRPWSLLSSGHPFTRRQILEYPNLQLFLDKLTALCWGIGFFPKRLSQLAENFASIYNALCGATTQFTWLDLGFFVNYV